MPNPHPRRSPWSRWHPALRGVFPLLLMAAASLAAGADPPEDPLRRAVADPTRSEDFRKRDADRKPAEVLAFFGIGPGMRVGEPMAARGYYTEILSRSVGSGGRVYAHNSPRTDGYFGEDLRKVTAELANVEIVVGEVEEPGLPPGLDAVLLIRFYHDFCWMESDRDAFNRAVFAALRPGGIYGVIDHHAAKGTGCEVGESLHRIDAAMVREEVLRAGFVLEAESDLLANPQDTHDWHIFREDGAERDRTDRFVYRFRKPE